MEWRRPSGFSYTGKESYKYAERLIKEGKEILIVSPYIDDYYARFLIRNSIGKKIKIISSSIEKRAKKRLGTKRSLDSFSAILLIVVPFDYLVYTFSFLSFYPIAASALILLIAFYLLVYNKRDIEIRIPDEFIHAKIYTSDRSAIQGSANLTYKGMHQNVEHIEIKDNKEEIEKLRKEFWRLWNSST